MAKQRRDSSEQIILKLREADVLLSEEKPVKEVCRHLEIHEQTYNRWRREYGGMKTTQVKKLKTLFFTYLGVGSPVFPSKWNFVNLIFIVD
jgi:transposase-like protein